MTSEPETTPRRRPPTLDLTAKEVEPEQPTATGDAAARAAGSRRGGWDFRSHGARYAVGALVGAAVAGAIIGGLWAAGLVPSHQVATAGGEGANPASSNEISSRLDKIQQSLQTAHSDQALAARVAAVEAQTKVLSDTLATRVTATEAQTKSLGDSLATFNRRIDEVAAAAQSASAQAKAAVATVEGAKNAAQTAVQRSDIETLTNRIAALENTVRSLSSDVAQRAASPDDRAARLTVAAEALRTAVEREAPYQAELAAVKALGASEDATAPLDPFVASGVPSATELAHELAALIPSLQQASGPAPIESSFLERLETHAQKLVRITPVDAPAPTGDAPSSVIARINIDAARGDIATALADIAHLPDATRALAASWVKKAAAREAALAASRRIAADALAALGKTAPQ